LPLHHLPEPGRGGTRIAIYGGMNTPTSTCLASLRGVERRVRRARRRAVVAVAAVRMAALAAALVALALGLGQALDGQRERVTEALYATASVER